jgi:hypothetical protein
MVRTAFPNSFEKPKQRRQRLTIDTESKADVIMLIQQDSEKTTPPTHIEIRPCCSAKFNKEMAKGRVNSFIRRYGTELIEMTSTPQDEPRLDKRKKQRKKERSRASSSL